MKKFQMFILAMILLVSSFSFQSCVKDEEITEITKAKSWIVIGLYKRFNTCERGNAFCIRTEKLDESALRNLQLSLDETTSQPVVLKDGSIQLQMEMDVQQLSPEARRQLFEEKVMVVDEDFALSKTTMQQAYGNTDLPYNGEQAKVAKGVYKIITDGGDGSAPRKIKITITITKDSITITVSW